jgi:hypothetical protein
VNCLDWAILVNIGSTALNIYCVLLSIRSRKRLEQSIESVNRLKFFYENKLMERFAKF